MKELREMFLSWSVNLYCLGHNIYIVFYLKFSPMSISSMFWRTLCFWSTSYSYMLKKLFFIKIPCESEKETQSVVQNPFEILQQSRFSDGLNAEHRICISPVTSDKKSTLFSLYYKKLDSGASALLKTYILSPLLSYWIIITEKYMYI